MTNIPFKHETKTTKLAFRPCKPNWAQLLMHLVIPDRLPLWSWVHVSFFPMSGSQLVVQMESQQMMIARWPLLPWMMHWKGQRALVAINNRKTSATGGLLQVGNKTCKYFTKLLSTFFFETSTAESGKIYLLP